MLVADAIERKEQMVTGTDAGWESELDFVSKLEPVMKREKVSEFDRKIFSRIGRASYFFSFREKRVVEPTSSDFEKKAFLPWRVRSVSRQEQEEGQEREYTQLFPDQR